jgi:phosphatidylserine/phosphatidylglycerophosphate/cardiolipin synthase-like enzyme
MSANAVELLARNVRGTLALALASSLEIDGNYTKAASQLRGAADVEAALKECFDTFGADDLAAVLRAFTIAADDNTIDIKPVWSGPTFDGDGDHTTAALAHLIDEATEDVFASTYSSSLASAHVQALRRALMRGVKVTLLVDTVKLEGDAAQLQQYLQGARFYTYIPPIGYGVQHSKVVVVDSNSALITSANLSKAAAESNLEAGVIVRDPTFVSKIRRRFGALITNGALVGLDPGA